MKILDFKDNQVVVDPHVLSFIEYNVLWERDRSKDKRQAFKELGYVYHMCDFNSPLANYPANKRQEYAIRDIIGDDSWKPDKAVLAACKLYKEENETSMQRQVVVAKMKMDEITEYFKKTPVDSDTLEDILDIFKSMGMQAAAVRKLEEEAKKELESSKNKVRGDKDIAMFEK